MKYSNLYDVFVERLYMCGRSVSEAFAFTPFFEELHYPMRTGVVHKRNSSVEWLRVLKILASVCTVNGLNTVLAILKQITK
jgi:hypothetical protein